MNVDARAGVGDMSVESKAIDLRRIALVVLAFVVLVARRPETIFQPTFWNEDGRIFYAGAVTGEPVWTSYQGYLHVIPRLIALVETAVPWPALLGNLIALLVTVGVAAFIASDRMACAIPERRARILAAAVILVIPAVDEVLGSVTYIQWWLALYLVLGIAAGEPTDRWKPVERVTLGLASLTGPFSIFVAPFYWFRRDRPTALVVTVGGLIQAVTVLTSSRAGHFRVPDDLVSIVAGRLVLEPLVGATLEPAVPLVVASVLIIPIALCLRVLPAPVLLAGLVVTAAGIFVSPETAVQLLDPYGAQRYFFVAGALIAIAITVAAYRRQPAGIIGVVLGIGILADLRLPPH